MLLLFLKFIWGDVLSPQTEHLVTITYYRKTYKLNSKAAESKVLVAQNIWTDYKMHNNS